jgi:hypothetical protein
MGMKPDMLQRVRPGARYLLIALIAGGCAIAATACGTTPAPSGASSAPAPPPKVSLDITVSSAPGAQPKHWTLRCDPAGGTHPNPAAACATLLKTSDPFASVPKNIMCPMIRVGTKTAKVEGTYFGKRVDKTFTPGGCTAAEWAKLGQIFN